MQKIPTVFKRDPEDMSRVLPEVHPDCEWVLAGEGVGTRKYNGTCVMFDGTEWWARREVKPGKKSPPNFQIVAVDDNTGKIMGWEPIDQSSFAKYHAEALKTMEPYEWSAGTFELCGPKVQGNPEGYDVHMLIEHRHAEVLLDNTDKIPYTFDFLKSFVLHCAGRGYEGIVWHHPDGRMAKLKGKDFPKEDN